MRSDLAIAPVIAFEAYDTNWFRAIVEESVTVYLVHIFRMLLAYYRVDTRKLHDHEHLVTTEATVSV